MPRHIAGEYESHWSVTVHRGSACHSPTPPWAASETVLTPPGARQLAGSWQTLAPILRNRGPTSPPAHLLAHTCGVSPRNDHLARTRRTVGSRYAGSGTRAGHPTSAAVAIQGNRRLAAFRRPIALIRALRHVSSVPNMKASLSQVIREAGGVAPLCDPSSPLGTGISRMWPCSGRRARSRRLAEHPRCHNPLVYAPPAPLRRPLRPCLPRGLQAPIPVVA